MDKVFQEREESIDFKRYVQIAFQHSKLGLLVIISVTILFHFYGKFQPEIYRTNFNLYYSNDNNYQFGDNTQSSTIQNEKKAYWIKTMESSKLYELVGEYSGLGFSVPHIQSLFTVVPDKSESLFEITLRVNSPDIIPGLVDGFVEAINAIDKHHQGDIYIKKVNYLNQQLVENERKLDSIDLKIMRLSNGLNMGSIESIDQVKDMAENFRMQLRNTEVELSYVQASKHKTQSSLTNLNDTLFEKSSFTEPLKVQLMNLHVDLARALTKYGDEHPVVMGIRDNIVHVEKMLTDGFEQNIEIKNIKANPIKRKLMGQLIDLKIQEISLQAKIKSLQNILNNSKTIHSSNQGLFQLLKKRQPLIKTIDFLHKKIITMEMVMKGVSNSFYLVDQPNIPTVPSNKSVSYYLLMGAIMGLFIAIVLIGIYDFIDDRIKLVDDFEKFFSVPIIGAIRHRKSKNLLQKIKDLPVEEIYESYENELTDIRINLKQLITKSGKNLFSVSSPTRKDGKTLVLYLLSLEFAKSGKKVALIDFDIYLPQLSKLFSFDNKPGIQDFLLSDAKFDEIKAYTGINNLDIIPVGENPYNVKLLYDTKKVDELLSLASQKYDVVLIDTPALLLAPQMLELLKKIDINIIVTRIGHSSRRNVKLFLEKLKNMPSKLIGTILTDIKPVPLGSYYDKYSRYDYYKYFPNEKKRRIIRERKPFNVKNALIAFGIISIILLQLALFFKGTPKFLRFDSNSSVENEGVSPNNFNNKELVVFSNLKYTEKEAPERELENSIDNDAYLSEEPIINHTSIPMPYHIIVGSFAYKSNAEKLVDNFKIKGYNECQVIVNDSDLYLVSIKAFPVKKEAVQSLEQINSNLGGNNWLYYKQ